MKLLPLMGSFAAVARAGSFTRAAAQLQVSKSLVSRHVSQLERQLGRQLLYRSTHSLHLTEDGEQFLAHCADLERVAEQASGFAHSAPAQPQGVLRLTVPQTLVVSPLGVKLCRPSEEVLDLIPAAQQGAFAKEDGEQVVDAQGRRVLP